MMVSDLRFITELRCNPSKNYEQRALLRYFISFSIWSWNYFTKVLGEFDGTLPEISPIRLSKSSLF